MKTLVAMATSLVMAGGCVPYVDHGVGNVPAVSQASCSGVAFAPFAGGGTSALAGQAFLKTRGGDVKYGAGNEVILVPAVDCAERWWNSTGRQWVLRNTFPQSSIFTSAVRRTVSDGEGRFEFKNIPPGRYFLRTIVTWEVPSAYSSSIQGGLLGGVFDLVEGEREEIILSTML